MNLAERLLQQDKRAAARLITMAENKDPEAFEIIKNLYHKSGNAYVIGITGPPGAGKSTLTDKLVKLLRKQDKTVAIIAVDPTSPFTGGSILGDRVRMTDLSTDKGIFIRSMGARGHLGGISEATGAAVKILDIFGFDYIVVETVGVGQSEIEIVGNSDTTIMVMVPGLGDDIQAIKAGIMEIGDVFAVNKADRDGAKRTAREINIMLDFNKSEWRPPVEMVIAIENNGVAELLAAVEKHRAHMQETGKFQMRRKQNSHNEIIELVKQRVMHLILDDTFKENHVEHLTEAVAARELDPYTASEEIFLKIKTL